MSYTVFARKYRPQTFEEIVGQEHIVRTLKNAIAQNRLAQAYLFVGPRGTGKTTTARILAKALNCSNGPRADFDPNDPACLEIAEGRSMNVLEFDAASNTQVEKIRELIVDNVKYSPSGGAKYKIYIVDEVHMLSASSFNALLKTLEEPPAHVKFVFATTNVEKVPTTIISRCQRFDLTRIPTPLITGHLLHIARSEQPPLALSPAAAEAVARGAEGGLRDAESMLDQLVAFCGEKIEEEDVLNIFGFTARACIAELCGRIIAGDTAGALGAIHAQAAAGKDLSRLVTDLIEHLRNLLVAQNAPDTLQAELGPDTVAALTAQAERVPPDKLLSLIEQFADAEGRMKWAANKKMHFEIAAIRAIQMLSSATLSEVLDQLATLGGGAAPTAAPAPARPAPKIPAPEPKPPSAPAPVEKIAPPPIAVPVRVREEAPAPAPLPATSAIAPESLWPQLVARVRDDRPLVSPWVEAGQLVEISNGKAALAFPPEAGLARESCERPNNRTFLEKLLSELAGQPLALRCETRAGLVVEPIARPEKKPETPVDPMEAFKNDPLIQKALTDFKAEILPA